MEENRRRGVHELSAVNRRADAAAHGRSGATDPNADLRAAPLVEPRYSPEFSRFGSAPLFCLLDFRPHSQRRADAQADERRFYDLAMKAQLAKCSVDPSGTFGASASISGTTFCPVRFKLAPPELPNLLVMNRSGKTAAWNERRSKQT